MKNATQAGWVDAPHKRKGKAMTRAHIEARLASARAKRDEQVQRVTRRLTEYHWWKNNSPDSAARPWFVFLFGDLGDEVPTPGTPEFTEVVMGLVRRASDKVAALEDQLSSMTDLPGLDPEATGC